MSFFRKALAGIAMMVAAGLPQTASFAMPFAVAPIGTSTPLVQDVRYVCDNYGCYDRPDFGRPPPPPPGYYPPGPPPGYGRPPPPPPGYYRPGPPPGPPPGYGRPPPPPPGFYRPGPPPGYGRPPPPRNGWGAHVRWCLNNHRAYDPDSNRYLDRDGRYRICRSPFR